MQLLISVIAAAEVAAALSGGPIILDVKNPVEGSLGAPLPETILQIRRLAPLPQKLSVAIGDLPDLPGTAALAALGAAVCGADYVKIGLRGPQTEGAAIALTAAVCRAVAPYPAAAVITAGYADATRAGTLDPRCLPRIAHAAGAAGCLIDTAIKDGRPVFDFLPASVLRDLVQEAHEAGLLFALAGTLRAEDLATAGELGVDVVGVRSAACHAGDRNGPLSAECVRRLHTVLAEVTA